MKLIFCMQISMNVDAAIKPKMPNRLNEHTSWANTAVRNVFDTKKVHEQSLKKIQETKNESLGIK